MDPQELTATALDHAWKRFEFRLSLAHQLINYFLVAAAILSAGYVGAVTIKSFGLAAALAFFGSALSLFSLFGYRSQVSGAKAAAVSLGDLESSLAKELGLASFQMPAVRTVWPSTAHVAMTGFIVCSLIGVALGVYALRR